MADCGIGKMLRLSRCPVVTVREGTPLPEHERYVMVQWMVPLHMQVKNLKTTLRSPITGALTYEAVVRTRLNYVADVIFNHYTKYCSFHPSELFDGPAVLAQLHQQGYLMFGPDTPEDNIEDGIDLLADAVVQCTNLKIDMGVTIAFMIQLNRQLMSSAVNTSQTDNSNNYRIANQYGDLFCREHIRDILDPNAFAITKHAHRSTSNQLKELSNLRTMLQRPHFPVVKGEVGSDVTQADAAGVRLRDAVKSLAESCGQIGSLDQGMPCAIAIRLADLRPNHHVEQCINAISDTFGVDVRFTAAGRAEFKLLDVGKLNGLLAWTASFSILQCAGVADKQNPWNSVATMIEGSDVRN